MGTKKVEKTGVYSNKAGHAFYLRAGEQADEDLLKDYHFDGAATEEHGKTPESPYFSFVKDAKPETDEDAKKRAEGPAPENRMDPPHDNRGAGDATDAENAANAAKPRR